MNIKRFSDMELYTLRNKIPVETLIKSVLNIPSEITNGYFRFQCPLCYRYNTAVKEQTNLARCFGCKKNFNTIDLVMVIKNLNFVQSITFLKKNCYPVSITKTDRVTQKNTYNNYKDKTDKGMENISQIINNMMKQFDNDEKKMTHKSKNDKYDLVMKHIEILERKVEYLMYKINTIPK